MYLVDGILVEEGLMSEQFACDLKQCKGACCTYPGDNGAPLRDDEIIEIENAAKEAVNYLSDRSKKVLLTKGFLDGKKGSYHTKCIDKKDCVFVFYNDGIAKCSLEKAYFDGKTNFRKPLSCHLFPVRIGNFGGTYLYYEQIEECKPALENGLQQKIPLMNFVKDSLVRALGEEWYDKMDTFLKDLEKK